MRRQAARRAALLPPAASSPRTQYRRAAGAFGVTAGAIGV
jgi:hypothetical protein